MHIRLFWILFWMVTGWCAVTPAADKSAASLPRCESERSASRTVIRIAWESPGTAAMEKRPDGQAVPRLNGFGEGGLPGEPILPFQRLRLLVPPEADLAQIRVEMDGEEWSDLPGGFRLAPAPPKATDAGSGPTLLAWGDKAPGQIQEGRDRLLYESDALFPASAVEISSVGEYRQYKLVDVVVHPVRCRLRSGAVSQLLRCGIRLCVSAGPKDFVPARVARPSDPRFEEAMLGEVLNLGERETWYRAGEGKAALCDVVLMTTRYIWENSLRIRDWVGQRQAVGYKVKVVVNGTAEDDEHFMPGSDGFLCSEGMRTWLQNRYQSWGFHTVMIVGNPEPADASSFNPWYDLPMKVCHTGGGSQGDGPTDMYFAELSNTWDANHNGYFGEFVGDFGAGGADRFCEINVGRIPCYGSLTDLDAIFDRILRYGAATSFPLSRHRVIIGGANSNFSPQDNDGDGKPTLPNDFPFPEWRTFGSDWGEALAYFALVWSDLPQTYYEKAGCHADGTAYPLTPCTAPLTDASILAAWQAGAGYASLLGHGNSNIIVRTLWDKDQINVGIADSLSGETSQPSLMNSYALPSPPVEEAPFATMVACLNGHPESPDNLGYSLLRQGSPGVYCATRNSFYDAGGWSTAKLAGSGDNASYGYNIYGGLQVFTSGFALNECRSTFGVNGWAWTNMVVFNYYGDPVYSLGSTGFPFLEFTTPISSMRINDPLPITWTTRNWPGSFVSGPLKISLSRDNGVNWETIVPSMENTGSTTWNVTGPGSTQCRLMISSVNNPSFYAVSPFVFTIKELRVTAPLSGNNWPVGTAQEIRWSSAGLSAYVEAYLVRPGSAYPEPIASGIPVKNGKLPWTVTGPPSADCRIALKSDELSFTSYVMSDPFTVSGIEVTSPAGGESWNIGENHAATWDSTGVGGNVRIELTRDYNVEAWKTLASSVPDTGSYPWPVTGPGSGNCRVRVTSLANPLVSGQSAGNFTVKGFTVVYPDGGENWVIGGHHTLQWQSYGISGNVKIELNRNYPAGTWETVFANTSNDGAEPWTTTGPTAGSCRLRITSVADPTVYALSAADFRISDAPLALIRPNGGEVWKVGASASIRWSFTIFPGNVAIYLNRNFPDGPWETLFPSLANTGSVAWTVTGPTGGRCRVRVVSLLYPTTHQDGSDANFRIASDLDLASPNGGEKWVVGKTATVTWTSGGVAGDVQIELNRSYPSGAWETLCPSVPVSAGSWNWTVAGALSDLCAVRLTSLEDAALVDSSADPFSIVATPQLSIVSPVAGQVWVVGKPVLVCWATAGDVGDVWVKFQRGMDVPWEVISRDTANNGYREVTLAGEATPWCRIRLESVADGSVYAVSDPFRLDAAPSLTVDSPKGGEKWFLGEPQAIHWTSAGLDGFVRLELNRAYPEGVWEVLQESIPDDGEESWTVTGPASDRCRVRASDPGHPEIQGVSDTDFRILAPFSMFYQPVNQIMTFQGVPGERSPAPQVVTLQQDGNGEVPWTLEPSSRWLLASPARGTLGSGLARVDVSVDVTGLWPGTYRSGIVVDSSDAVNTPFTIPVTLVLTPTGDLNGDGQADIVDLTILRLTLRGIIRPGAPPCSFPEQGDFNGNGALDEPDLALMERFLSDCAGEAGR